MNQALIGWTVSVVLASAALAAASGTPAGPQVGPPSARWLGQVGTDRVGRSPNPGPNGVQDMVIALTGLPVERQIHRLTVRGHGGDAWEYRGSGGHWAADLWHEPGSDRAVISVEPSKIETGRAFQIEIEFEGGQIARLPLQGGQADPIERMPEVRLSARWAEPDGSDRVGPGPSVGPDGFEDVRIELARLDPEAAVSEVLIRAENGPSWSYGPNPDGNRDALFTRSTGDPSRATLAISPSPALAGRRVRIDLSYDNGTRDRAVLVAGASPVDRAVDRPALPVIEEEASRIRWLGQVDDDPLGPGAVRLEVDRPTDRTRAVILSDGVAGAWVFERPGDGDSIDGTPPFFGDHRRRLDVVEGDRPGSSLLTFVPYRRLEGGTLTLRFVDEGGRSSVLRFPGGPCDPLLRFETPADCEAIVSPGDDLAAIAEQGGTIRLRAGTYPLDRPLDLTGPTTLLADPGAELRFRQRPGDEPWGEAIAIRGAGRTTIEGLRVRFDSPVRWHPQAAWGGAIIGVSNLGKRPGGPVQIEVRGLDLEAPPASTDWEPAPNCLRLVDTDSGVVEGCTLRGGAIELFNGPWRISDNRHRGTMPATFAGSFLSGHLTRDVTIAANEVRPDPGSGKLYRFLVLTDRGVGVEVRGNRVVGVGPMDDDERPHPNAPEVLLTESYAVRFEGRHVGLTGDGGVLAIPAPQGSHPEVGEVVAAVSGPDAGRWAVIDQVIDRNLFLLDRPFPEGEYDVSITPGFVGMTIEGNTIDCRGSTEAHNVVLTGNHYGTRLVGNALLGGSNAVRLSAYASNQPYHYAWTHTPQFDLTVDSNTVVDSHRGGLIAVAHGPQIKTNRGRVYLTGSVLGNTFRWTADAPAGPEPGPAALTIGQLPSLDPGELVLEMGANLALDARGEPIRVPMRALVGTINGRPHEPPGD